MALTARQRPRARLLLEDGRVFDGRALGALVSDPARCEIFGEVIFNTSMTGYQEIISDPSYCRQLVTFTAPQLGNYGVCAADDQGPRPHAAGVVLRELSRVRSSWRADGDLEDWLSQHAIGGICEVDTRALTRHIRSLGAMRAGIFVADAMPDDALERVRAQPKMEGQNLAEVVSTREPYQVPAERAAQSGPSDRAANAPRARRVALLDFGVKRGIVSCLTRRGVDVTVLPASSDVAAVRALKPDGVLLSNGPGDPAPVQRGVETARQLIGELPLLGICLGHQILGLALGGESYKMRFGHHGGNHPVRDERTGELWITAQNHGFAVRAESLPPSVQRTHVSLYDGSLEGFADEGRRVTAVQFHPEACPGPSDAAGVFDRFVAQLEPGPGGDSNGNAKGRGA